jgi:glutamate transport system substrate-binding protein
MTTAMALLIAVLLAAGCSPRTTTVSPTISAGARYFENPVPIGVKYDQPGFSVEANGAFAGFDIDLSTYLATRLGFSINSFEEVTDLDRSVSLGKTVKLVVATFSITPDREQGSNGEPAVDFAGPYMQTPDALLVKQGSKYATANPDLIGAKVCTLPGSTTAPGAVPLPRGVIVITSATDYGQCVQDVESGAADAVFTDSLVLDGYAADTTKYPGLAVEKTQYGELNQYGIGLPHGQAAACEELIPLVVAFLNDGMWAQYFRTEFPGVVASDSTWQQDFKPNVNIIPSTSYCK